MIIFMGPPGSGKSVQGQLLAARHEWRWLSAGQLLRDTKNERAIDQMKTGDMVEDELVNEVVADALERSHDITRLLMDGFPRSLEQAKWLIDELPKHERSLDLVIVLNVPEDEIMHRLHIRGRLDDDPEIVRRRIQIYKEEMQPIIDYYKSLNIPVEEIDGVGSVGTVHDRIHEALEACSLA